jgi:glycosyltransferase involved in cell wall biosynthesis
MSSVRAIRQRPAPGVAAKPLTIVQVGMSTSPICGVRDHAQVLEAALVAAGARCSTTWCNLSEQRDARATYRMVVRWLALIRSELDRAQPTAVVLHYSAFAFGVRGLPIFARRVARELGQADVSVVGLFHELAYPFRRGGWRGAVQATAQRAALIPVLRVCDTAVVTTEQRMEWLETRRWLPRRPVTFVPVPSNLPPVKAPSRDRTSRLTIGVVGFGSPGAVVSLVVGASTQLHEQGRQVRVLLLGAPGRDGPAAERWRKAFSEAGQLQLLAFTGIRDPHDLAEELSRVDVVVFADASGPDSRRGMLVAALAAGKAIIAPRGPETWPRLVSEAAVVLVPNEPAALAAELKRFAEDVGLRARQETSAAAFYSRHLTPEVVAARIATIVAPAVTTSTKTS